LHHSRDGASRKLWQHLRYGNVERRSDATARVQPVLGFVQSGNVAMTANTEIWPRGGRAQRAQQ
jgi:hypothetical protein